MRAVLEFVSGSRRGQQIVVPMDRSVSIGRTSWSEIVCEDDARMSKVHFYLKTDIYGCYLQDHQSRNGTFVKGMRVVRCVLCDGDTIQAGNTTFRVQIEGGNLETASSTHDIPWVPSDIPQEEMQAANGKLHATCTIETCDSGLTLCRGSIDDVSPGTIAKLVSHSWPLHLIVDFTRMGVAVPPEYSDPQYLFDWLDPAAAAVASPVVISPVATDSWRTLVNDCWGQDGVVVLFSQTPSADLLSRFRDQLCPRNGNARAHQSMFGYCWPGVLAPVLMHSPRDLVGRLTEKIDAMLLEFPDLPDTWQLFGDERLPKLLQKFGFVESKPGDENGKPKIKTSPPG